MKRPTRPPAAHQQELELRTWGGRRAGAGPKSAREKATAPHRSRPELRPYQPVHVSLRMADHVWNLRSQRSFSVIHAALSALRHRSDIRVTHFSVQGNHLHLIAEADGARALATGIRALSIRLARGLNRMMGRSGPVLEDRYHAHVLRTPAEVRNSVAYVVGNYASHAARRGERVSRDRIDPFSSSAAASPRRGQLSLWANAVTEAPATWLLRTATASSP